MSILALTQKLIQRGSDVDAILQQLHNLKKSDFVNESQHCDIIVSRYVQFCDYGMQHGRHAHVAKIFNSIHIANSDDEWLPAAFNCLSPKMLDYYDRILASIDHDENVHPTSEPSEPSELGSPNLFRLRKCDVNSLRLMSAIFELCVDFCDVMYAGDKLFTFVKPLYTLICIPDFQEASVAVTAHGYALNELLRSASFAISNFLLTFTSLAPKAKQVTKQQVEGLFKTLSCAPELSIQRSLILTIRSLYEASDHGYIAENASAPALSVTALRGIIERKLSTSQFGSGRALASFRALKLDDQEFLKNYENVIKLIFFRKRKAQKCFSTDSCVVQVQETLSKRKRVIEAACVEWNMNSVCVRDQIGNPVQNWPFFTVLSWEWLNAGKEMIFTFDRFHQLPSSSVKIRFERTLKRNDRKILEERIDNIQTMVPKKPTQRVSRRDPMHQPGQRFPVAVSIALEDDKRSMDSERNSEEPDASTESERSSEGNRVETILSGFQDDGVFIRKRTGSKASSEESRESSQAPEGGEEDRRCALDESSAESAGTYDLFRDSGQHEVNEGHEGSLSELQTSIKAVGDNYSRAQAQRDKIPTQSQSLPPGPEVLRSTLPALKSNEEGKVGQRRQDFHQSQDAADRCLNSKVSSKTDESCSMLSGHEVPGNDVGNFGKPIAVTLRSREERAVSVGDKPLGSELRGLRLTKRTSREVVPEATNVVDEEYDCGQNLSLNQSNESRCTSNYAAEILKARNSLPQGKRRDKGEHQQMCENSISFHDEREREQGTSMEADVNGAADDENQSPTLDFIMIDQPFKAVPSLQREAAETVHMSEVPSTDEAVDNENERMRKLLANAVQRMLKCQVDSAHKMVITTRKEVRLLQKEKKDISQQHLKAYESKVEKLAEERKEQLQKYANQHGALISKARGLARELKVKLVYGQNQLKIRKQRAQRMVGRIRKQLETARKKMDYEFKELLASNKKREERNTRSSLAQNLISMLGGDHNPE